MKVHNVINLKNINYSANNTEVQPYLYTKDNNNVDRFAYKEHKAEYFCGILGLMVAAFALTKFIGRNPLPQSIVEFSKDKVVGFNKISDNNEVIENIKSLILYPLKSYNTVNQHFKKRQIIRNSMKTGLVIGCENEQKAIEFMKAFLEHAKLKEISVKTDRSISGNKSYNATYKVLKKAERYYIKHRGRKASIAYIGDLSEKVDFLDRNISKESIELKKRLDNQHPGVIWVGWTKKVDELPYFYNNTPTLYLRLD